MNCTDLSSIQSVDFSDGARVELDGVRNVREDLLETPSGAAVEQDPDRLAWPDSISDHCDELRSDEVLRGIRRHGGAHEAGREFVAGRGCRSDVCSSRRHMQRLVAPCGRPPLRQTRAGVFEAFKRLGGGHHVLARLAYLVERCDARAV